MFFPPGFAELLRSFRPVLSRGRDGGCRRAAVVRRTRPRRRRRRVRGVDGRRVGRHLSSGHAPILVQLFPQPVDDALQLLLVRLKDHQGFD